MIERFQIGEVRFEFEMPLDYSWQQRDMSFLYQEGQLCRKSVKVTITEEEQLKEPHDNNFAENEKIRIWQKGNEEIRSYRAVIKGKYDTPFAISKWSGDNVDIRFNFSSGYWNRQCASLWSLIHIEGHLLLADSIILHSCYTQYKGDAILFTAPSGTGKTTQGNLWKRVYGSQIVNGDLCLMQKTTQGWDACGFPMSGSADECENLRFPIKAVVVVRQSPTNWIEELNRLQRTTLLFSECFINTWDKQRVNKAIDLLSDLAEKVPVVMLHCNMEEEAPQVLHEYLYRNDGIV